MSVYVRQHVISINYRVGESWTILSPIEQIIKSKIEENGIPLKKWNISIQYGVKTGLNDAFIITDEVRKKLIQEDPNSAQIIRPILRGRDIYKDQIRFSNLYVITAYKGIHEIIESKYPAVYSHLKGFETQLRQRGQVEGKPGKSGSMQHHWTELDNNISLEKLDDFNSPKILFSEMVKEPQFYLDKDSYIANDTVTFITGSNIDNLVKMLNSKTIFTIYKNFYAGGGLGQKGVRVKKTFLETLPLPLNLAIKSDDVFEIETEIQNELNFTDYEKAWINNQVN
ncbi:hypothetical protein FO437_06565 [Weissella cibaria]|uniref:TaqI-like C-terminal specificity domain-containing protein n=2 Tax=Weissella cibaria TaxID=137591 RepID=UPI001196239A|nr:TaqI-like C-terminal specificity domain-containing protein [Weissella cibaria]TVV38370.1 hypothetical protein FO437_06565 [Weissella cibaria]